MKLHRLSILSLMLALVGGARTVAATADAEPVHVTIHAAKTGTPISPFIYGQFIEHLGRCIYGGIWAEMLEDRKFYFPITDKYAPYDQSKDTKFPAISASPWEVTGPAGSVTMVKKDAFVGDQSPLVSAGSGIRQNDLGLVAGRKYVGYIWVRAPDGSPILTIHFNWWSSESLTSIPLPESAGNDYQKIPFEFTAHDSTDKGSLTIEASGAPLMIGAVSLMPADNIRGFRADTLALLKQLHGTIYRWPGGNFVSGYDWRDGIGPRDRRPPRKNPAWSGIDSNDVGIDEFLDLCREIDAEPLVSVNTGFGDDYSAAQEVEYANGSKDTIGGSWRVKNGHARSYHVKYWCVGNEMWGPWQLGHMEFNQYVLKHERFARAMRKVDPGIILIGSGDRGTKVILNDGKQKREMSWSAGMLRRCGDSMNYISEHFYEGRTPWGSETPKDLPAYVALLKDEIRKKASGHRELQSKLGRTPDKFIPIAMDEWNYWHRGYVYGELGCQYSLADALGVAAGLHEYFRNSDIIQMANYAQTVNVVGCIKTTKTTAFFATTALPLMLYRREFGSLPLAVTGNQADRAIDVVAAKTKDGRAITIGIVNPQSKPQTIGVTFEGIKLQPSAAVWRIAGNDPDAINTAAKQAVGIVEQKNVPFGDHITVPAYSVNVFRVPVQ